MPKAILVVESAPSSPDREDDYNAWYSGTHIPEILAIPGYTGARRFRATTPDAHRPYLAVYDIEADDVDAAVRELSVRTADGRIKMSDVLQLDPPPIVNVYEVL